jgi:SnoaL-like domain
VTQEELLVTYERAWNTHDPGACAECFAHDGVRELRLLLPCASLGHRDPLIRGREEIAEHVGRVMDSVPDLSVEVCGAAYSSDRRLWTEWRVTGTIADDLGRRPTGGRPIDVVGVSVFRLSNEGFTEERLYWDSALVVGGTTTRAGPEPA